MDLLDVLGDDYIAQHIQCRIAEEDRTRLYRQYVTDALYSIAGGPGALSARWADLDTGWTTPEPAPQESAAQVKSRLVAEINGEEGPNEPV